MEELFNILSCGARFDKSKSKKKNDNNIRLLKSALPGHESVSGRPILHEVRLGGGVKPNDDSADDSEDNCSSSYEKKEKQKEEVHTKKHSIEKQKRIHLEEMAAFRRRLNIHLGKSCRNNEELLNDPISTFEEIIKPSWWKDDESQLFTSMKRVILQNIEGGKWLEPTPIQMQCIPSLLTGRRDVLGAAPTGSGKSGAFIIPALFLAAAPTHVFYGTKNTAITLQKEQQQGQIRTLLLAPSRELASQLYREVCRLGFGYKKGGLRAVLLSKQNTSLFLSGKLGGTRGVDVLVSTPLRLVTSLKNVVSSPLSAIRLVVLDEADRLLDATDGSLSTNSNVSDTKNSKDDDDDDDEEDYHRTTNKLSGSAHVRTFVEQVDDILAACPSTAIRALFSATMGTNVRNLAESILRNPMDVTVTPSSSVAATANPDIDQKLLFVGKEEGKLLAIRQLIQRGIKPPVLIFLQSKERAQALFGELMYDGVNVDVLHSDKSRAARDAAIDKFRRGDTWFLITTDLCARGMDFKHLNVVINYDLPTSGVSYIHRIGRCGRAGRKGEAVTLFTESDFDHLRTIANIMKLSGCEIPDWMLSLKKESTHAKKRFEKSNPKRKRIDTIPSYDRKKIQNRKQQIMKNSTKITTSTQQNNRNSKNESEGDKIINIEKTV